MLLVLIIITMAIYLHRIDLQLYSLSALYYKPIRNPETITVDAIVSHSLIALLATVAS